MLLLLLILFIAWPHVRQYLIDVRNQILYPAPATTHVPGRPTFLPFFCVQDLPLSRGRRYLK